MFDSLSDRIREDDPVTSTQRYLRLAAVFVIAGILFTALYLGVKLLEY